MKKDHNCKYSPTSLFPAAIDKFFVSLRKNLFVVMCKRLHEIALMFLHRILYVLIPIKLFDICFDVEN